MLQKRRKIEKVRCSTSSGGESGEEVEGSNSRVLFWREAGGLFPPKEKKEKE